MTIKAEIKLHEFKFWGGAKEFANRLSREEFDLIEEYFEELGSTPTETEVNDFFWFEADFILSELLDKDPEEFWAD